jgi:hypothetical protein
MRINFKTTELSRRKWDSFTHSVYGRKIVESKILAHKKVAREPDSNVKKEELPTKQHKYQDGFCTGVFFAAIVVAMLSAVCVYLRAAQIPDSVHVFMTPSVLKDIILEFFIEFLKPFGLVLGMSTVLGIVWIIGLSTITKKLIWWSIILFLLGFMIIDYAAFSFSKISDDGNVSEFQRGM